jgi:hypothetical protein
MYDITAQELAETVAAETSPQLAVSWISEFDMHVGQAPE